MPRTEFEEMYYSLLSDMATAPLSRLHEMEELANVLWAEILKERKENK